MASPVETALRLSARWPDKRPVEIIETVIAEEGIQLVRPVMHRGISGFFHEYHGYDFIGINVVHSETRQRFTLAHELYHYIAGHQVGFCRDDLFETRSRRERDANTFAAHLLMPAGETRRMLAAGTSVLDISLRWGVSPEAAAYRVNELFRAELQGF